MNTKQRPGIFKRHLQVTSHRGRASSDFPIRKLEAATRACDCNVEWLTIELVDDRSAGTNYDTGNVDLCCSTLEVYLQSDRQKQRLEKLRA